MNEWIQRQIAGGFNDFKGLSITAHIPIRDQLVNELLADALQRPTSGSPGADLGSFLKFVKKAEVHASEGTITVDLVISV
jgi:hypothetical protein